MEDFEKIEKLIIKRDGKELVLTHRHNEYSNLFLTIENQYYDFLKKEFVQDYGMFILNQISKKIILGTKLKNSKFNKLINFKKNG